MFGSLDTLDEARLLLEKAQGSVAARRQKVHPQIAWQSVGGSRH
jgi:hypothetical protein